MARSEAGIAEEYLSELPEDKRALIEAVRKVVLKALPKGYVESMTWGMPSYEIPLERYPDTYNKKPLNYAALGAQKNYCSLYLMCAYQDSEQEKQLKEGKVLRAIQEAGGSAAGCCWRGDIIHNTG